MTSFRTTAMGLIALLAVACSDATSPTGITGTWNLRAVDGRSVDTPPPDSASAWIRTHEQLTLKVDGSYLDQIQSETIDGPSGAPLRSNHASLIGQWTGDAATLTLTGDRDQSGTISGDTLRIGTTIYTR